MSRLPAELATGSAESAQGPYRLGEVLTAFRGGVSAARERAIEHAAGATSASLLGPPIKPVGHGKTTGQEYLAPMELRVRGTQVFAAIARLRRYADVAYAEPNYLQQASAAPVKPNDPEFGKQWGDENTGQLIPFQDQEEKLGAEEKGTPGADDKATQAWSVTTGSRSVVIGEVDSGVAYEHPDLAANIWSNPGGIGGCEKGTHGYNVLNKTCNPIDEDTTYGGHGTHVAGIMGAVGNNGTGVAGMNWQTTILPVRWLNSAGSETSALIEALQWLVSAKQAGVNLRIVNDSDVFFAAAKSEALAKEIETLGKEEILFVTAAGNGGNNLETEPHYPCAYNLPTEICVTASNNKDELPTWANTGAKVVKLAAPGVSIYSTLRENKYGWLSGGSMAAPQVSGAAGLILSVSPSLKTAELKERILNNVDKLSGLAGKVETGGRLDVCKAVPGCSIEAPPPPKEEPWGKQSVGGTKDYFGLERKRVNCYAVPSSGAITKLNVYLEGNISGQQVMKGIIYSDPAGKVETGKVEAKPEKLLGVSEQLTFTSTGSGSGAGWYELRFSAPVSLSAGNYCIGVITGATEKVAGFRWDSVTSARGYNPNTYSSGPTNPFGAVTIDSEQTSLYASYVVVPVNTSPPTISGEARQEQLLTEAHGTWLNEPTSYTYKWQQCDSSGNNCSGIGAATAQTYTPVAADVGHTLRVQETAHNAKGESAAATSAATAVVLPAPPTNTSPPTINGASTAQQGVELKEEHGAWTNNPTAFSYQWQRCESSGANCANISGAEGQGYTPVEADVGHKLRVLESASNAGGKSKEAASSALTAVVATGVPQNLALPEIIGPAQQGQTLTEAHGKWTNNPTGYTYQWQQCNSLGESCVPISGATQQTYMATTGDVGRTLRVQETAINGVGSSAPATSKATEVVKPLPPQNSVPPKINGASTAQQGVELKEEHGTWTNNPTAFSYQWQRCESSGANCANISGAEAQSYTPVEADVGHKLIVLETASNAGGSSEKPAPSETTAVVLAAVPANTSPPKINGASTAQQGIELKEEHGTWTNNPTTFTYQWERCEGSTCANIAGAEGQGYTPVEADVGHTLKVLETASNAGGKSKEAAPSAVTAVVLPAPPVNTGAPKINGASTAQQGIELKEEHGAWTNNPTAFTYQWQRCEGSTCANISGAEGQGYTPVEADVGHTLKVLETASNAGGKSKEAAASAATAVVLPEPPVDKTPPTIKGGSTAQQGVELKEEHGTWSNNPTGYTYQWLQCNNLGASCLPITGAKAQTYTPVEADVGHTLKVQETASNASGASKEAASSEATAVVLSAVPANTSPPTITGASTAQQGIELKEEHGAWTNNPTAFTYQWQRCEGSTCVNIAGAEAQGYTPVEADVGRTLKVLESASNASGKSKEAAPSAATAVVLPASPTNTSPPTITGAATAQQGIELKEEHGAWTNNPTTFTYQWQRCEGTTCANIAGAEGQGYTPVEADVNHTLKVLETASNAGGKAKEAAPSAVTAAVLPAPPVNTSPPKISGASTAQQGVELKEEHGTWTNNPTTFTYQWQRCEGTTCANIAGAEGQGYTPVEADVNHTLKVLETASNAGGKAKEAAASAATAVVLPAPPVNTAAPKINGASTAQQGVELKEEHGTWTNNPTGYTYQWEQCEALGNACLPIAGAKNQTYIPQPGDVGFRLRVQETAENAGGKGTPATSEETAVVLPETGTKPTPENQPTISGEARQGQTLTEQSASWRNEPTSFTYQWLRCNSAGNNCANIAGAEAQTYTPVELDVGHRLRVQEEATNSFGSSAPDISEPTAVVLPLVPTNTSPPTINGASTAQQGVELKEEHGTWANNPTGYTYQWQRCEGSTCANIAGAEAQGYTPVEADVGHTLKVLETASNAGGKAKEAAPSAVTAVVLPAPPVNTAAPKINGASTAQQGVELKEEHGTWTNNPTAFTYQWQRCEGSTCANIAGAEGQGYTPVEADVNHTLKVLETASNAGGKAKEAAASGVTEVVKPPPPSNVTPPTIKGANEAQQGKELKEEHGAWTNNPTAFSYQWQRCESAGANCANIAGAEAQGYTPVEADVGHTLKVLETASNAGGQAKEAAASAATAVVLPEHLVPVNETPPTITGTAEQGLALSEGHGKWSNEPLTGYGYQWQRCNGVGAECANISGAEAQSYTPVEADVGHTLRVKETASNSAGASAPATSEATAVVRGRFGKTNIGASKDQFGGGRKRVNRYPLPTAGAVTKLTIYLEPTGKPGQQVMKGVIYADQGGTPTTLLGVTEQLTFHNTSPAGWYETKLASPLKLAAGNYWIGELTGSTANVAGFRYDSVAGSRDYNGNVYASGPSNPFGTFGTDAEQTSLYATFTPGG